MPQSFNERFKHDPCHATNHLFEVNEDCPKLDSEDAILFHHLVAKLFYPCKCTQPDIQLTMSFLMTQVQSPHEDDFKPLDHCLHYLCNTKDLTLTLEARDMVTIKWWVEASFTVHHDYKSHTGVRMSFGLGSIISLSNKQKINTHSLTEAELVGVNDMMSLVLWVDHFYKHKDLT